MGDRARPHSAVEPVEKARVHRNQCGGSATDEVRARTRPGRCLGVRRRRVLKNAADKKRRCNPNRVERGNLSPLNRELRLGNEDRCVVLLVFARGDQRHGAFVVTGRGILVSAFVRLRRDRQEKRQKQRGEKTSRDQEAEVCAARFHPRRLCFLLSNSASTICRRLCRGFVSEAFLGACFANRMVSLHMKQ